MHRIEIQVGAGSHTFSADEETCLLDQVLAAGIQVDYSCRRGDCGQCVGTLQRGDPVPVNPSYPCHSNQNIYLCNALPRTDMAIRMPHFPELDGIRRLRSPSKIHQLNRLGVDVMEVVLRLPPTTVFNFLPGQFIRLTNKERITRSYSLAAPLNADKLLRLHVKRVNDGPFSHYLFETAKPGDLTQIEGPQGHFFLSRGRRSEKTIFLATGTGIAPIFAMLSSLTAEDAQNLGQIDVYWGNRHKSDEYLAEQLRALSSSLSFSYSPLYSREGTASDVRHAQLAMARNHLSMRGATVFACGSPKMIQDAQAIALALGLNPDHFHSDPFTPS